MAVRTSPSVALRHSFNSTSPSTPSSPSESSPRSSPGPRGSFAADRERSPHGPPPCGYPSGHGTGIPSQPASVNVMSLQFDRDLLDCAGEPERSGDVGPGLDRRESNPRGRATRNSNDRLIHRPDGRPGRHRERRPLHPGSPFGQELLRLGVPAPPQRLHRPSEPQFVRRQPVLVAGRHDLQTLTLLRRWRTGQGGPDGRLRQSAEADQFRCRRFPRAERRVIEFGDEPLDPFGVRFGDPGTELRPQEPGEAVGPGQTPLGPCRYRPTRSTSAAGPAAIRRTLAIRTA